MDHQESARLARPGPCWSLGRVKHLILAAKIRKVPLSLCIGLPKLPIGKPVAISSVAPMGANAAERSTTVEQLNQYLYSENGSVRASAIESLSYWNRKNDATCISNGSNDDSAIVRVVAVEAAGQTAIASNEIKLGLFAILNNELLNLDERIAAANALQLQDLSDHEYDILAAFTRKYLN